MKKENNFWIIVDDHFPTNVSYKHTSLESAQNEAKRLARKAKDKKFVIMRSIESYQIEEFVKTDYVNPVDNPDDSEYIPF